MITSKAIYRKDANGKIRFWQYEVDGDKWRSISGMVGGAPTAAGWTVCKPKSKPTAEEQAAFEAAAEEKKKLDREYRSDIADLDSVPYSPMLAQDFKKQKVIVYPVYEQPKLDGIRALTSKHGGFSREYQPHQNIEHILETLVPVFKRFPDIQFDGELYNHDLKDDFNSISSIVRKTKITDERRARARQVIQYHVYDLFVPQKPELKTGTRSALLHKIITDFGIGEIVRYVPTSLVRDLDELDARYGHHLEQGYEGQMVRLDAPYEPDKRSKTLLKRKEFITAEFKLKRVEEGQGTWAGYAKRAVFELEDGRECGAGIKGDMAFARSLLEQTWTDESQVTIKHFTRTPDGVPRFPVATDFHLNGRID